MIFDNGVHSARVGNQIPRILHSPMNMGLASGTAGPEAVALAAMAGLHLDPWESLVLEHALSERDKRTPDGIPTWAALEVGLMVSRQNGKGSILEARELAGLFLLNEKLIIHSAHQFDTSVEAFQRIEALISGTPELKAQVAPNGIKWSHGSEGITLKNGNRLRFRTRTKGGGRGFTADCIILDEAMYLTDEQMQALMFTISARTITGNPQIWYTGSAGDKDSTQFGRVRSRGMAGKDPRLVYLEWSADVCGDFCPPNCTEHDPQGMPRNEHSLTQEEHDIAFARLVDSYAKANPGLGIRIALEQCEQERRSMSTEAFAQERLGVGDWPVEGEAWRIISEEAWLARIPRISIPQRPLVFGVDISPDRKHGCITAAGFNGEVEAGDVKQVHIEVTWDGKSLDYRSGTDWIVPRCKELHRNNKGSTFVIDKVSQAGPLVEELEAAGLKVLTPTAREYAQWCGVFYSAVVPQENNTPYLVHSGQPMFNSAVAGAEKRDLADCWAWDRRNTSVDICPLVSATLALYGHDKVNVKKTPSPGFAFC